MKDKSLLRQAIAESDRVGVLAGDQSGSAEEVLAEAESGFPQDCRQGHHLRPYLGG